MWKYFINNLIMLPLKFIGYLLFAAIGSIILCLIFYIGLPAIIILAICGFVYFCYDDAKRRYDREREMVRRDLSHYCENTLMDIRTLIIRNDFEELDKYKSKFIKYMDEYKKEFGEDSYYKNYYSHYLSILEFEKEK